MTQGPSNYAATFAKRPTEELVRVTERPENYDSAAVAAAAAELTRREIDASELDGMRARLRSEARARQQRDASRSRRRSRANAALDVVNLLSPQADSAGRIILLFALANGASGCILFW